MSNTPLLGARRHPVRLLLAASLVASLAISAYAAEPANSSYASAAEAAAAAATAAKVAREAEIEARKAAHIAAQTAAKAAAQAAAEATVANRLAAQAAVQAEAMRRKLQPATAISTVTGASNGAGTASSAATDQAPATASTPVGPRVELGVTQDKTWGTGGSVKLEAGNETLAGQLKTEFTADAQASTASAAWQFQQNRVLSGSVGYTSANASKALQGDFDAAGDLTASNVRVGLQTGDSAVVYEKGKADDADLSATQRYVGKQWQEVSAQQRLPVGEQAEVLVKAGVREEEQGGQKNVLATGGVEGNYYLADNQGKVSAGVQNMREGGNYEAKVRYEQKMGNNSNAHWFTEAKSTHGSNRDTQWMVGLGLGEGQSYIRPAAGTVNALSALDRDRNTLHYTQFDGVLGKVEEKPDTAAPQLLSVPSVMLEAGKTTNTTLTFSEASSVSLSAPAGITATLTDGDNAASTHALAVQVATTVAAGSYAISLTATDARGNSSSASIPVTVTAIPDTTPPPPPPVKDADGDGVVDETDNCPAKPNLDQADLDGDKLGDACDTQDNRDTDGDGVQNHHDQCLTTPAGATVTATGCQVIRLDSSRPTSISTYSGGAVAFFYAVPDLTRIENAQTRITASSSIGTSRVTISSNAAVVTVTGSGIDSGTPLTIQLFIDGALAATAR